MLLYRINKAAVLKPDENVPILTTEEIEQLLKQLELESESGNAPDKEDI
jgi:hypothetical protein